MENKYIVYRHVCPNKKVYVGITKQTANGRWKNGLGYQRSPHFWNAIQKYGWENIEHEILLEGLSKEDACSAEARLIRVFRSTDRRFGYNEKSGGETGVSFNEDVRKRISESRKRFYAEHPDEKEKLSQKIKGFRHTETAKEKMREAAKRRPRRELTETWKDNIGEANRRRLENDPMLLESTIKRCVENGMRASRPVIQMDLDGVFVKEFQSSHEAQRATGIRNGNISKCCNGKAKTAGGFLWKYKE